MKSLQEILDLCKIAEYDDYKAIEIYLRQNARKSAELLYKVLNNRVAELEKFENDTKALLCQSTYYYYEQFDNDTASMLDTLTRKMMMQIPFDDKDIEFMRGFDLSKAKSPFYHDLAEAIRVAQNKDYRPNYFNYKWRSDD